MKIAILAWGSETWDLRDVHTVASGWHFDGPLLPIEFARTSDPSEPLPRLMLVLHDDGRNARTLWAQATSDDFDRACASFTFGERDSTTNRIAMKIGYLCKDRQPQLASITDPARKEEVLSRIERWRKDKEVDAVIWSDLESNLLVRRNPSNDAVAYLEDLQQKGIAAAAKEYFQRTPAQIVTNIREQVEAKLGWLPSDDSAPSPISTGDDLRMKEWAECRTMIGRFDTILADLRKFGFSLITGLLTAGAVLGFVGVQIPPNLRTTAFITIMILITALFSVDTYYQVLLSAAVERALDLEVLTSPKRIRVTKYLSVNATDSKAAYVTLFLYLLLLLMAGGLGLVPTEGLGLGLWKKGPSGLLDLAHDVTHSRYGPLWLNCLKVGALTFLVVWACQLKIPKWLKRKSASTLSDARHQSILARVNSLIRWTITSKGRLNRLTRIVAWTFTILRRQGWLKLLILWALGTFFLIGPGAFIVQNALERKGPVSWVVTITAVLATYIDAYWLYIVWKSGLYGEKPARQWPEGADKVATG